MSKKKRFFTPDINSWKYLPEDVVIKKKKPNIKRTKALKLSDERKDALIDNSTELIDFTISFTKTVVRISFVLFVIVNLFILTMTTVSYFHSGELMYLDTLITESYGMLRDVIAAYIIKAATENSLRIGFSVLSDYLDKKYDIKYKPNSDDDYYEDGTDEEYNDIDILPDEDEEDPMNGTTINEEYNEEEGGIDFIKN